MSVSTFQVLRSLVPDAKCAVKEGPGVLEIVWSDSRSQPTDSEVAARRKILEDEEPKNVLREHRNNRLSETDWMANSDVTMTDAWKTYRQQLRDMLGTANPILDSEGLLIHNSVTWPTKPS
tara:strand:+ start:850 stop:1212 length:363 start_codon:yes stop_codon:yes gene_type:complete